MIRFVRMALIVSVVLLLVVPAIAQMSSQPQNATVQPGPRIRPGLPYSADVFVNGKFAMRIPASAGGLSPMQRAQRIADRLNQQFAAGASWQNTQVGMSGGQWIVALNNQIIATADQRSARAYRVSEGQLASRWARQSVVAMGGQPQMIAQQLQPVAVAVAGAQQELGMPPVTPSTAAGMAWSVTPSKSVPVLDYASGNQIGTVMIGGPRDRLNAANAVVLYTNPMMDNGTGYLMVPITGTSTTGTLTRAQGVGVVSAPTSVLPIDSAMSGSQMPQITTQTGIDLLNEFVDQTRNLNLETGADEVVVPLYSMDTNQVVGAAYIVGNAAQIGRAKAVVASTSGDTMTFRAVSSAPPVPSNALRLNNVVLSGVVLWMGGTPATPGTASPPESDMDNENQNQDNFPNIEVPQENPNAPETSTAPGTPGSNF